MNHQESSGTEKHSQNWEGTEQKHSILPYESPRSDEISLVDIGVALWRHWKTIGVVFSLCVGLSIAFALITPKAYQYSTTIQIGTKGNGNPVESPQTAASKLINGFLPEVIEKYTRRHHISANKFQFKVNSPPRTNLVFIRGRAPRLLSASYIDVERAAASELVNSELRLTQIAEAHLKSELAQAKAQLTELTDPKYKDLLKARISSLKQFHDQAQMQQLQSSRDSRSANSAMTLLLLSNQAQQAEQRLAGLEQQLDVKLPNKIISQKAKVDSIQVQLQNLEKSQIVAGPFASLEPVGVSRKTIVIVGAFIGIFLGIAFAFLSSFIAAVRKELTRS